jgi:hypothetical protein
MAGVEGTVHKELFPKSQHPFADLKELLTTPEGIEQYIHTVRNSYIKPLFYVLKSTRFFNPMTKMRVPIKKGERVDPNLAYVSIEDQKKVYKLFGFQGHVGSKKVDEDAKRDELLEKLKGILYYTPTLVTFIHLLLQRGYIFIPEHEIRRMCEQLKQREDYDFKSFCLPAKWYHDASWMKLRYVYGGSTLDKIGGGDGGISNDMAKCVFAESYLLK